MSCRTLLMMTVALLTAFAAGSASSAEDAQPIDWNRAQQLFQKSQRGEKLSAEDQAYLDRAKAERQKQRGDKQGDAAAITPKASMGLIPLTQLGTEKYQGEDGGLYGGGKNEPPEALQAAAKRETAKIVPLDAEGKPSPDGKVVLVSLSMSNATMEFSTFKTIADADPQKSPLLTIVDCAQGGMAMGQWAEPAEAAANTNRPSPWIVADQRLTQARLTSKQVQIAWVKLAVVRPTGDLQQSGKFLQKMTVATIVNAKARYPNLKIVYLSTRIYGGNAKGALNPEPYAYEGAFAARWLIQDQIKGSAELNYDPERGAVKAPLLLWGPYLWADGVTPRKSDGLIWEAKDFGADGTHPSESGRKKVAQLLLDFFKTDANTKTWFCKPAGGADK